MRGDRAEALIAYHDGCTLYFCSKGCREAFEASAAHDLDAESSTTPAFGCLLARCPFGV
jgi:YHS domain-containing protein